MIPHATRFCLPRNDIPLTHPSHLTPLYPIPPERPVESRLPIHQGTSALTWSLARAQPLSKVNRLRVTICFPTKTFGTITFGFCTEHIMQLQNGCMSFWPALHFVNQIITILLIFRRQNTAILTLCVGLRISNQCEILSHKHDSFFYCLSKRDCAVWVYLQCWNWSPISICEWKIGVMIATGIANASAPIESLRRGTDCRTSRSILIQRVKRERCHFAACAGRTRFSVKVRVTQRSWRQSQKQPIFSQHLWSAVTFPST